MGKPQAWYASTRWRRIREIVLTREPLCRMCKAQGRLTPATVVDHIRPHKGDPDLFFALDNLQPLCAHCHNARKQMQDLHGYSPACDEQGFPLDDGHPFNYKSRVSMRNNKEKPRNETGTQMNVNS